MSIMPRARKAHTDIPAPGRTSTWRVLDQTGDTATTYDLSPKVIDETIAAMETQFKALSQRRVPFIVDPVTKATTVAVSFDEAARADEVIWAPVVVPG